MPGAGARPRHPRAGASRTGGLGVTKEQIAAFSSLPRSPDNFRMTDPSELPVLVAGDGDRCKLRLFTGHQLVEKPSQQFSWSSTTRQSSAKPNARARCAPRNDVRPGCGLQNCGRWYGIPGRPCGIRRNGRRAASRQNACRRRNAFWRRGNALRRRRSTNGVPTLPNPRISAPRRPRPTASPGRRTSSSLGNLR
jgi:hypothetical protein